MKKILSAVLAFAMLLSVAVVALTVNVSAAEKKEITVKWNDGYAVISPNNAYSYTTDYATASTYSSTDVFTVAKAGTRITWTDDTSSFATNSVAIVSNWDQVNGQWVMNKEKPLFVGASGKNTSIIEKATLSGSTVNKIEYTYITHTDNENLRLCVAGKGTGIKVYAEEANIAESSWDKALAKYPAEPPIPVNNITGTPVNAEILQTELKWKYGYVGSATHSSQANKIKVNGSTYVYSSVFTIPKAGTTIYFYDDTKTDCEDSEYASSNCAVFSFWKAAGNDWLFDSAKPSIDGSEANQKLIGGYKLYWYTTTEDNENIRISYRAGIDDYSLAIKPYNIYVENPTTVNKVTDKGTLKDASYTDANGNTVNYKIYLPENYKAGGTTKVLFNLSSKTDIVDGLIADKTDAIIVSYNGDKTSSENLVNDLVKAYGFNKHFMYMIGSTEICSSIGKIFANYITADKTYTSAIDEGKALLAAQPNYYAVLENTTMYAIGDSYFAGSGIGKAGTWVNQIGEKYGMHYVNYGIGGSTVSDYVTTNNPMCVRFKDMEKGNADIILLEGGRNDRSKEVPLGENTSKDTKTFKGALNVMIDTMFETYPNALIILVTPWYTTGKVDATGHTNITYADAMRDLAAFRNDPRIVCLYAADPEATGVNMNDAEFRAKYSIAANDVSHLNNAGMDLVLPYMEKFVADAYAKFRGLNLDGVDPNATTAPPADTDAPTDNTTTEATGPVVDDTTVTEPAKKSCGNFAFGAAVAAVVISVFGTAVITKKKF